MRKVSLIGNSLAYCLNQERQRATDYRPGMTSEDVQMRKVSLIGNSLAYCLSQERQRATDYRSGMTPEDVRVVFEKSLRGERKKSAATRNDTRKERAVRWSPHVLTLRPEMVASSRAG